MALPVPEAAPHNAVPTTVQLQTTLVSALGTVSATATPATLEGPLLETVMEYETAVPGTAALSPSDLVMRTSAVGFTSSVSVAELSSGVNSVMPGASATAVFTNVPTPGANAGFRVPVIM